MANGNGTNGHTGLNGNSLAALSGAKVRVEERVSFPASDLERAIAEVRRLGATGQMTISFLNGRPAGDSEWKTSKRNA